MGEHTAGTPCDDCLDWRLEQSRHVGEHIADVIRDVLRELGIDPEDEHVGRVVARELRAASPHDPDARP